MNPRETPQPFDAKKVKDFNNFFDWLPGGRYRSMKIESRDKKLIRDIDMTVERLGIDAANLFTEMDKGHSEVMRGIDMMKQNGDSPEAREISKAGDKIRQEAHKKLIPLFEELVKLGYNPNELMS